MFGKRKGLVNYLYFQTADGCYRMVPASPTWEPTPSINVPLDYPTAPKDWMNQDFTDDDLANASSYRVFQLMSEEFLPDNKTKVFTYREVRERT